MKFYVAYRFTGEEHKELEKTLRHICNLISKKEHHNYCSFFDPSMVNIGNRNVMLNAFKKIDESDALLVFIKSKEKSEGMFLEVGYALSKNKKVILLVKKGVETTYVNELADKVIEFENLNELNEIDI